MLHGIGMTLVMDLAPVLLAVSADRVQMQRLVLNLARTRLDSSIAASGTLDSLQISSRHKAGDTFIQFARSGRVGGDIPAMISKNGVVQAEEDIRVAMCRSIVQAQGGRLLSASDLTNCTMHGFVLSSYSIESKASIRIAAQRC